MTDENRKYENAAGHGSYERQDLQVSGILYFLLTLGVVTAICIVALWGLFGYFDRYAKSSQPAVNPLITHVPEDTRHVPRGYPQSVFPDPKLEEDERGQLNAIRMNEQKELYSYGWVDEKAGTVHIPIERAMDLIVQRGLPVRPQGEPSEDAAAKPESNQRSTGVPVGNKAKKK
jgi:hypothetical protein